MARSITLTLGAGLGADLGPNFNLTANVGSVTPSTATKTELTAGKSVSVDDAASEVTVTSTGTCTNAITQTIPCVTTTTTTTTAAPTTTTAAPTVCFEATVTSTDPTYGATINGYLCDGTAYYDPGMFGTQTICVQSISVAGGDYTVGGACYAETTTTTTTTEAPPTTTTAAPPPETVFCDCGGGCEEYIGTICPPGCSPCSPA
jgi:hypothetical protein